MAWTNPRVHDVRAVPARTTRRPTRWSRRALARTGRRSSPGCSCTPSRKPKPAYSAFELPIWLPDPTHGPHVFVWGQIRPRDEERTAALQFRASGAPSWENVATVRGAGREGFFTTHVSLPSAGQLRISWLGPGYRILDSRLATVASERPRRGPPPYGPVLGW